MNHLNISEHFTGKLAEAIERDAAERDARNRNIMVDLEKRGWNELRHYNPAAYRK